MSLITLAATRLLHLQEVAGDPDVQSSQRTAHQSAVTPQLGGCVDSPEAATLVLLCVGMAGLALGTRFFRKLTRT